jgi:putative SOS response-associated peptidase YedK
MPAILHPDNYAAWLDPEEVPDTRAYFAQEMEAHAVSTFVNNPRNRGPQCHEAIPA